MDGTPAAPRRVDGTPRRVDGTPRRVAPHSEGPRTCAAGPGSGSGGENEVEGYSAVIVPFMSGWTSQMNG